ncbi:MAG TPA: T9SS type A sorting domain-containing protein [Puia sp.]|uniref:T9SS type A sorting domain-containing protein n=1 Tax=Puia sp. TaxID=2045100 RepID=UPI002B53DFA4|nr:T9SS type A sorting domain-containing protein [Puia sp.]HVU97292.1 T9SS type A sorting domain-containing protein [Puia sp.]
MKNLTSLPILFLVALGLPAAAQAPAHVQTKSNVLTTNGQSSISVTFNSSSSSQHLIIVHVTWDKQNRDVSTVSDTRNVYHLVSGSTVNWGQGSTKYRSALYYAYSINAGATPLTIKATLDGAANSFIEIYASEYSGVLTTTDPLDQTKTTTNNSSSVSTGTVTTTQSNELVYGVAIGASSPLGGGSGFTVRSTAQDNIVEDKIGGSAGSYGATFTGSGYWVASVATFKPLVSLPVSLASFDARLLQENKVELDWATASEVSSDHFEVEHSRDGQAWTTIGSVDAAGNSATTQQYSFVDDAPFAGTTLYRLKQSDRDGNATVSKTVTIHIDATSTTTLHIYPNPAASYLVVEGATQAITIFSTTGQRMLMRMVLDGETRTTLDLTSLPKGAYYVKAGDRSMLFSRL